AAKYNLHRYLRELNLALVRERNFEDDVVAALDLCQRVERQCHAAWCNGETAALKLAAAYLAIIWDLDALGGCCACAAKPGEHCLCFLRANECRVLQDDGLGNSNPVRLISGKNFLRVVCERIGP